MKDIPSTLVTAQKLIHCKELILCVYKEFMTFDIRSDNIVLGCCGFHGDVLTLTKHITARLKVTMIPQ